VLSSSAFFGCSCHANNDESRLGGWLYFGNHGWDARACAGAVLSAAAGLRCAARLRCAATRPRYQCRRPAAAVTNLRATYHSRTRLFMGPRLLGLGRRLWVLLGARNLGPSPRARSTLDTSLLGLERRGVCILPRLLVITCWVLWRCELWLWLYR